MVQFIYTESGIPKSSVAENERRNLIGRLNQDLMKRFPIVLKQNAEVRKEKEDE